MAKRQARKASRRTGGRKTQRKGGSLRMGEGENFGKGQQRRTRGTRSGARRVRSEAVTREAPRGSSARPGEQKQSYEYSEELEQGF